MSEPKEYNSYNSVNLEDEEGNVSEYKVVDSYRPNATPKDVGKLDEYNKDKELYNRQKSKVHFQASKGNAGNIDDFVPETIGNAIDSVFSKVDSLLDATGKFLWGPKKTVKSPAKTKANQARPQPQKIIQPQTQAKVQAQPRQQTQSQSIATPQPQVQQKVKQKTAPIVNPQPQVQAKPTPQPKPAKVNPVGIINKKKADNDDGPPVKRTTPISDLDLPLDILNDQDLVRYFDQMKLYDKKVPGGLCGLSINKASKRLSKGRWGKKFMISYEQLKINTIVATADAGLQRFNGMKPVYKAVGSNFKNTEELRKAIEEDINLYIRNGDSSDKFHKFTYTVARPKK